MGTGDSNRQDAHAHFCLGYALYLSDDQQGAIAAYEEAIKLDPEEVKVHRSLAMAFRKKGDEAAAQKTFQRARELLAKQEGGVRDHVHSTTLDALRAGVSGRLTKDLPVDTIDGDHPGFHEVYAVTLEAGKHYRFDLTGTYDTLLRIEDAKRRPIAVNDDIAHPAILNSRLVFTPPATGVYHLIATSCFADVIGDYTLKATEVLQVDKPVVIAGNLVETTDLFKGKYLVRHRVPMDSDRHYVIELLSSAFDTHLVLGSWAENGGIVPGNTRHARIDFTPTRTSEFTVGITSRRPGQTGEYTVTIRALAPSKKN